jgi:hypothetical protein
MNFTQLKSLFFKVLIGCLLAAAGVAVVAILVGEFNNVIAKAIMTIIMVAIHSAIALAFIENSERQHTNHSLPFFSNALFGIIALSFLTSVLGTWEVITFSFGFKLYFCYFVLLFAVLHAEVLARTTGKQSNIDKIVLANFALMAVVVLMLFPVILMDDSSQLGPFYFRVLAAAGIVDATLTLVAVILHRLYMQKHPEHADPVYNSAAQTTVTPGADGKPGSTTVVVQQPRRMNIFVVILIAYLVLQFLGGFVIAILGRTHY